MLHCPKKSCILLLIIVWWWRCLIEATSIQNLWTKKNNMGNPVELCEPRSEVEWVGVNQGENLCLCMCVHTCICLEKEWRMWCNICEMFFQTSSTSQRRLSLIFNLNPTPPTPLLALTPALMTLNETSALLFPFHFPRMKNVWIVFTVLSCLQLDSGDFTVDLICFFAVFLI